MAEFNDRLKYISEKYEKPSLRNNSLVGQFRNETHLFNTGKQSRSLDPLSSSLTMAQAKDKDAKAPHRLHLETNLNTRPQTTGSAVWGDMRKTLSAPTIRGVEVALTRGGKSVPGTQTELGPPPSSVDLHDEAAASTRRRIGTAPSARSNGRPLNQTWGSGDSTRGPTEEFPGPTRYYPHPSKTRGQMRYSTPRGLDHNADPGRPWGMTCPLWDAHQCRHTYAKSLEHAGLRTPKKSLRWRSQEHWHDPAHHPPLKVNHIAPG